MSRFRMLKAVGSWLMTQPQEADNSLCTAQLSSSKEANCSLLIHLPQINQSVCPGMRRQWLQSTQCSSIARCDSSSSGLPGESTKSVTPPATPHREGQNLGDQRFNDKRAGMIEHRLSVTVTIEYIIQTKMILTIKGSAITNYAETTDVN